MHPLLRMIGPLGVLAALAVAAVALAVYASVPASATPHDPLHSEAAQPLPAEMSLHPPLRHIGDFFPPGR